MMYFSCKEGKAVNVYDFDNTIYDGESGFDIFMFYLKKDPKEIAKLIPRFGEAFIRYKRGAIKTDEVIEQYGDMLTDYCVKIKDIHKDITEFWDEHEKENQKLLCQDSSSRRRNSFGLPRNHTWGNMQKNRRKKLHRQRCGYGKRNHRACLLQGKQDSGI